MTAGINKLCQKPGPEGMAWRLIRGWDPAAKLTTWLEAEKKQGLTPNLAVEIVAEAMAATAMSLAMQIDPGERRECLLSDKGLVQLMVNSIQQKLMQVGGRHNILPVREMPNLPPLRSNGRG